MSRSDLINVYSCTEKICNGLISPNFDSRLQFLHLWPLLLKLISHKAYREGCEHELNAELLNFLFLNAKSTYFSFKYSWFNLPSSSLQWEHFFFPLTLRTLSCCLSNKRGGTCGPGIWGMFCSCLLMLCGPLALKQNWLLHMPHADCLQEVIIRVGHGIF